MKKLRVPKTDSIRELAEFFDTHDTTDLDKSEWVEVESPFIRKPGIRVELPAKDVKAVEQIAKSQGLTVEALVKSWIRQKLPRRRKLAAARR